MKVLSETSETSCIFGKEASKRLQFLVDNGIELSATQNFREVVIFLERVMHCMWLCGCGVGDSLLEVGSNKCANLYMMAGVLRPGSNIVSIDMGKKEFARERKIVFDKLKEEGFVCHYVAWNSHLVRSRNHVMDIGDGTYDIVYIDADHSYKGLSQDLKLYAPLRSKHGVLAIHDIAGIPAVAQAWQEVVEGKFFPMDGHVAHEIRCNHSGKQGIGLVEPSGE